MLKKLDIVQAICQKMHHVRKDKARQDLTKRELLLVNAFMDVLIERATSKAKAAAQPSKGA